MRNTKTFFFKKPKVDRKVPYYLRTYKFSKVWIKGNFYSKDFNGNDLYFFLTLTSTYKNIFFNLVDVYGKNIKVFSIGLKGNKKLLIIIEKVAYELVKFLENFGQDINIILKINGNYLDNRIKRIINILSLQSFIKLLTLIEYRTYAHNGIRKRKKKRL